MVDPLPLPPSRQAELDAILDQRDKAEAVAHILQGQLTERTRERDARTEERDSARDLALVLIDANDAALALHAHRHWCHSDDGAERMCAADHPHMPPCATYKALTGSDSPEVA